MLSPQPHPVIYSTDRSKAVVLVLFFLFAALCSFVVPALLTVFFSICVVMLALWSPSSIDVNFAFCFTSCAAMLAFWSPSAAAHFAFGLLVVIKNGIGTQGEVCCKSALTPHPTPGDLFY